MIEKLEEAQESSQEGERGPSISGKKVNDAPPTHTHKHKHTHTHPERSTVPIPKAPGSLCEEPHCVTSREESFAKSLPHGPTRLRKPLNPSHGTGLSVVTKMSIWVLRKC